MNFKLTAEEKQNIVIEYGSSIGMITRTEIVLNGLNIIDDYDDFKEVICLTALESEAMKLVSPKSTIKRKNLSEIIASVLYSKYANSNMSDESQEKLKEFVLKFYNIEY